MNSATAEQTVLRIALRRRTLSARPQQHRAWSLQRSRTSPHSPQAASQSQTGMRRRRCKATLKRGDGMCVSRQAGGGREPCACARCAAGIEVEAAGPGEGGILEKLGDSVGLDLARQGLLRRDVGLRTDTGTGGNDGSETAPHQGLRGQRRSRWRSRDRLMRRSCQRRQQGRARWRIGRRSHPR